MSQDGDVHLINTADGGEISVESGIVKMGAGLDVCVYLSMFGGNEHDSTLPDDRMNWWGNISEQSEARRYRSQTQYLLSRLSATSANLLRIKDAVERDLKWLITERVASDIRVAVSIPALNAVKIAVDVEAVGEMSRFEYTENWLASA